MSGEMEVPDADMAASPAQNDAAVENGGSAVQNGAGEADAAKAEAGEAEAAAKAEAKAAERTARERDAEPMEPVRGMAVRGEVRHVAEDRGHMHVQVMIAGRKFKGMVREVRPDLPMTLPPCTQLRRDKYFARIKPPWRQPRGKSEVNLPHMPPDSGGICMGVD